MKTPYWPRLLAIFMLGLEVSACSTSQPMAPANHSPVLVSLTISPTDIGFADSAVVTCIATDQDGNTLVYDWEADQRLRIKGSPLPEPIKNNTLNNAETLYVNYHPIKVDTVWVGCEVRDGLGGGAARAINFTVHP